MSRKLPDWFYARSPQSMDSLKGPDAQYEAGARDMLDAAIEELLAVASEEGPQSAYWLAAERLKRGFEEDHD
jgi:hypothetical protein